MPFCPDPDNPGADNPDTDPDTDPEAAAMLLLLETPAQMLERSHAAFVAGDWITGTTVRACVRGVRGVRVS